jgi:hypothetical protein
VPAAAPTSRRAPRRGWPPPRQGPLTCWRHSQAAAQAQLIVEDAAGAQCTRTLQNCIILWRAPPSLSAALTPGGSWALGADAPSNATLLALAGAVVLVVLPLARRGWRDGLLAVWSWPVVLAAGLALMGVAISFVPSPSFPQYFVPPIPFLTIA